MIRSALERWQRRTGSTRVGVAVSGGRDSMVLWHAAVRVFERPVVIHVDHGFRAESLGDRRFVEAVAEESHCPTFVRTLRGVEPREAAWRAARQAAFREAATEHGLDWVLLGHHQGDQAETVLLHLLRGGRIAGMPPFRWPVARPLLGCPAAELHRYAGRHRVPWREDRSNRDPRWMRNRIRKELLPLLERAYRPGIVGRLASLGEEVGAIHMQVRPLQASDRAPRGNADPWRARFDAAGLEQPRVRPRMAGDRAALTQGDDESPSDPEGMYAADVLPERGTDGAPEAPWVVADGSRVLWIPGVGRSGVAPITAETRWVWDFLWKWG